MPNWHPGFYENFYCSLVSFILKNHGIGAYIRGGGLKYEQYGMFLTCKN